MSSVKTTTKTVDGPASSVKTTTYETRTTYESEGPEYTKRYRSLMAPRSVVINRSGPVQQTSSRQVSMSMGQMPQISAGAYAAVTQTGVSTVKTARVQEKKDMQDLNERFASYIEKVRFLEAQNRKLADELDKLKSKWGKETTAIKAMYQAELDEARRLLDDSEKEKARLEIRCDSLEMQNEEIDQKLQDIQAARQADRETIDRQNQQLSDYEAEINMLRRRCEQFEIDREKDKKEIIRLTDLLNRARIDLDNETLAHIDAENRRQTLEEELEFLKSVHEQEMKELAALAYRDTTAENREFWKNEMGSALREIQAVYDEKIDLMRGEMDNYYTMKMQEFRTGATRSNMETVHSKEESKRLKTQLADLRGKLSDMESRNAALERELENLRREYADKEREWEVETTELKNEVAKLQAEMEAILKELQDIMDTKLGLELEIAAYRKLLEGEENRIGLRKVIGSIISTSERTETEMHDEGGDDDSSLKVSQVVKGEMSAKTTYQRSAKGPVSISECAADGRYICIENTGRKAEDLGEWTIKRVIDGSEKPAFTFDRNFSIKAGAKVKIWGRNQKGPGSGRDDLECNQESWGIGANINTKLCNPNGEDRATHVQKTIYTSGN